MKNRRLLFTISAVLIITLIILWWVGSHALLSITILNPGRGGIAYSLTAQSGQHKTTISSDKPSLTKRVGRGTYDVLVSQGSNSYFVVVKTGGFLAKTAVKATLQPEKSRTFVGDNPAPCMFYTSQLYSYECASDFSKLSLHVPATPTQPSYTKTSVNPLISGLIEGVFKTAAGNVVVVHPSDLEGGGNHVAYLLNDDASIKQTAVLPGLSSATDYSAVAYAGGFLLYDSQWQHLYYFKDLGSPPQQLNLKTPADKSLQPVGLRASGDRIAILYSDQTAASDTQSLKHYNYSVILYANGGAVEYKVPRQGTSVATPCGQTDLCLLAGGNAYRYATSGNNLHLEYEVSSVSDIYARGNSLLLIKPEGVLVINSDKAEGYLDYSFGGYSFCGYQPNDDASYLLCIINGSKKSALLVNQAADNKDSIDKLAVQLRKNVAYSDVTVYKSLIFITPNLPLQYDQTTGQYEYSKPALQAAESNIKSSAASFGLPALGYQVIDTLSD